MTLEEVLEKVKHSEDFAKEKIGIHDWISLGTKELTSWNTLKRKLSLSRLISIDTI